MTAQPTKFPWQEIQRATGQTITQINPLELGRPFQLTDEQRAALQPYTEVAGKEGAVLIVCNYSPACNFMHAVPVALRPDDRGAISRALTKIVKKQRAEILTTTTTKKP